MVLERHRGGGGQLFAITSTPPVFIAPLPIFVAPLPIVAAIPFTLSSPTASRRRHDTGSSPGRHRCLSSCAAAVDRRRRGHRRYWCCRHRRVLVAAVPPLFVVAPVGFGFFIEPPTLAFNSVRARPRHGWGGLASLRRPAGLIRAASAFRRLGPRRMWHGAGAGTTLVARRASARLPDGMVAPGAAGAGLAAAIIWPQAALLSRTCWKACWSRGARSRR